MNTAFKEYAKAKRVKLYQVAQRLNTHPSTFSVQYMRRELTKAEEKMLRSIVDAIATEKEAGHEKNTK